MGKMIESGGGRKNAQGLTITITIVKFVWIAGYGLSKLTDRETLNILYSQSKFTKIPRSFSPPPLSVSF